MVLVTGATGLLGRVIVLELLKRGKSVRATKRTTSNLDEVRKSYRFYTENPDDFFSKIQWIDVDFQDIHSLEKALHGIEEVYHTAAWVSFNPKDRKKMYAINIRGTKNLLYACENSGVQKFCHVSSIAVLDGLNEEGELDEDSDFNPKLNHSDYAVSKHYSEMEVWRASAEGLNVVTVNPGIIIGSGNWEQSSGTIFRILEKNKYTFPGGSAYVDVRDVAKICIELVEKNAFGERFIAVAENVKYFDISTIVREKMGLKKPELIPEIGLKAAGFLGNILGWLIPKIRLANSANIKSVTSFNKVSNKKILKEIDFKFIPIEESIDFHLNNYKADQK